MDPGASLIIASLTKETATVLIQRHGSEAVIAALRAWVQYNSGRSSNLGHEEAIRRAKNAIPSFLNNIESNKLRVIPGAFNSAPEFIAMFQAEALVAIPVALLLTAQAIERVGSSLQGIQRELTITNMAKIQGWEQEGFGTHVYRFVEYEMLQVANARAKSGDQGGTTSMSGTRIQTGTRSSRQRIEPSLSVPSSAGIIMSSMRFVCG
jgi:hypothetical protein